MATETSFHLTILIKKLDKLSFTDFHTYWSTSHPKIWLSVPIVQQKVIKYSQFHVDHGTTRSLEAHGLSFVDYDGGVNIWTNSVEDMMAVSIEMWAVCGRAH